MKRTVLWAALGVGLASAGLVGVLATREPAVNTAAATPLLGQPAPEIAAATLDGGSVRLSEFRGRWVLVNFFNSWCVPCRQEHPELLKFAARHAAPGDAVILGVVHDDDPDEVRKYRAEHGGDWPAVDDPRGTIALEYGVRGQPETFVVSPAGVVVARYVSAISADGMDALLRGAA